MPTNVVVLAALRFALVLPAIILHEVSHGYVAYLLGDPTAKERGRLTLNPIAHIDPFGTLLMPILLLISTQGTFAFGFAKPVPVNPYRLTRVGIQNGMLLTGIAGPVTNFVLAVLAAIVARVLSGISAVPLIVVWLVAYFCFINLILGFFNLIPIPPLDGSRVVQRFLSGDALKMYSSIEPYGIWIVLALVLILPTVVGFDPLTAYWNLTLIPAVQALLGPLYPLVLHG